MKVFAWLLRLITAIVLGQSLYYKFTAQPESVYIFSKIGLEPAGRYIIGAVELIAVLLILIPRLTWLGAMLTIGVLSGAVIYHLTSLGIDVQNDGGQLFFYALSAVCCAIILLILSWRRIPFLPKRFRTQD